MKLVNCVILILYFLVGTKLPVYAQTTRVIEKKIIDIPQTVSKGPVSDYNILLRNIFTVDPEYTWEAVTSETDLKGTKHTRLRQLVNGIPLTGITLILHQSEAACQVTGEFIRLEKQELSRPSGIILRL